MGIYLNPGNESFQSALRSQIYVDKTGILEYTNSVLDSEQRYICVSRPRRFGKSMTAEMLAGDFCAVNPAKFQNDMISFKSKDDILTLLVHLILQWVIVRLLMALRQPAWLLLVLLVALSFGI